ncbi:MAG TPA: GntR family transcriptional regulator [Pyrinomonadaceae bacterium]|jgi:GntR family transcriptional regulator
MDIQLKPLSEGPIYLQVRTQIEAQIRDKQLAAGTPLPAPAALAQQLGVDKGEIQRAYYELEHGGLVTKTTNKGFLGGKDTVKYHIK